MKAGKGLAREQHKSKFIYTVTNYEPDMRLWKHVPSLQLKEKVSVGGMVLIGLVFYTLRSTVQGLSVWDERFYAGAAFRMVHEGFWSIPRVTFKNGVFLEKPPLAMWLQALSVGILGDRIIAVRFPSIVATLAVATLTYFIGREIWSRVAGFGAMASVLASPALFWNSHSGITADTDALLLLFGTLFVWWTWRGGERPQLLPLAGIAAGFAVLTKGVAAGVFVVIVLPIITPQIRSYFRSETLVAVALTSLIVLPWNVYAYLQYPHEYITQMYQTQVIARATGSSFVTHSNTLLPWMNYPYFQAFPRYLRPFWVTALIGGVGHAISAQSNWEIDSLSLSNSKTLGVVWWTLAPLLTFAMFGGNHIWYLLPMVVPISLLSGRAVELVVESSNKILRWFDVGFEIRFSIVAVFGLIGLLGLLTIYPGPKSLPQWDGQNIFQRTQLLWDIARQLYT